MEVAIVAAVARNGVIGIDGRMPWDLPEDLRRFKATTDGHPVIMGRRTYESIVERLGGPLPDRTNVVMSRGDPDVPAGVVLADSVEAALEAARATGADVAYVIGGGSVYEQFLPRADRLVLTEVDAAPEGDTRFPDWDRDEWAEVARDEREGFAFVEYVRRGCATDVRTR
jgi:dihydrofolate reductase